MKKIEMFLIRLNNTVKVLIYCALVRAGIVDM